VPQGSPSPEQHIEALWPALTRQPDAPKYSSLLPLPHPYVVPGGRFREVYYWDSYFTLLGLRASGRIDLMRHMVDNFAFLIGQLGFMPNGNRAYYLSRSQPPFFALMVGLLAEAQGQAVWDSYLPALQREYAFWMSGSTLLRPRLSTHRRAVRMSDGSLLNRYWDDLDTPRPESYREDVELAHSVDRPASQLYRELRAAAESGWDFSSRWFGGEGLGSLRTTELIPVDLNCLLWYMEKKIADTYEAQSQEEMAERYYAAASQRADAIRLYCWHEEAGFYCDHEIKTGDCSPHLTLAGVFPLFFELAPLVHAERVAQTLREKFLQSGGLSTTLLYSGQQWDAPNGWAPLQWICEQGLLRYGYADLAHDIRQRWLGRCREVYAHTGKMMEKYDVYGGGGAGGGGEYPNQDGFGWTNGVFRAWVSSDT
ncbi:MAG TPA: alpha,alpha-trehalase TreF, partial [Saprospiraceae bacterium]|nr:alpha,alpha-trehalase TreF [Saprospiraceae bacterium]